MSSVRRLRSAFAPEPQGPLWCFWKAPVTWALPHIEPARVQPGQSPEDPLGSRCHQWPLHYDILGSCARLTSSLSHHGWPCAGAACVESSRVPPELGAGHQDSEASCQPCWVSFLHWWRYGYLGFLGKVAITVLGEGQGSPGTNDYQELVAPRAQWGKDPHTLGLGAAERAIPRKTGFPAGTRLPGGGQCQVVQPGEAGGLRVAHSPFLLCSATLLGLSQGAPPSSGWYSPGLQATLGAMGL